MVNFTFEYILMISNISKSIVMRIVRNSISDQSKESLNSKCDCNCNSVSDLIRQTYFLFFPIGFYEHVGLRPLDAVILNLIMCTHLYCTFSEIN